MKKTRKTKGLGRSIEEIFAGKSQTSELPIDQLTPSANQPRKSFDNNSLNMLAKTIRERGVLQPVLVRQAKKGYEIIAGERRWRAAQIAGLKSVPVVVRMLSDKDAMIAALVENIQRQDLNVLDQANAAKSILDETKLNVTDAANSLGLSRSALSNLLRLLKLENAVQKLLLEELLSEGHGRVLVGLEPKLQIKLARQATNQSLSVRQLEALIKQTAKLSAKKKPKAVDSDAARLCDELSAKLGMRVSLEGTKNKGKLVINYRSLDSLDAIIKLLRKFK